MTLKSIQSAALKLPPEKRSKRAAVLLSSLETEDSTELERMWVEKGDRRYRSYRSGRDTLVPAKQAIAAVRASLAQAV